MSSNDECDESIWARPRPQTVHPAPWTRLRFNLGADGLSDGEDATALSSRAVREALPQEPSFAMSESDCENFDQNKYRDPLSNTSHRSKVSFKAMESTIEGAGSSQRSIRASQGLIGTVRLLQSQALPSFALAHPDPSRPARARPAAGRGAEAAARLRGAGRRRAQARARAPRRPAPP